MDAPLESLGSARAGYNIAGVSFTAEELANEITVRLPNFVCSYEPDIRQKYADSWPSMIDDSQAQNDWGWEPQFGLEQLVEEMLENLS
jgi:nucleoside-diphosphate-sugar epimerase